MNITTVKNVEDYPLSLMFYQHYYNWALQALFLLAPEDNQRLLGVY